jgi:hypothetical protein
MNKLCFAVIFMLLPCLYSCRPVPELGGNPPFVVSEIVQIAPTTARYYCKDQFEPFTGQASIILPNNMYHVGDTIKLVILERGIK